MGERRELMDTIQFVIPTERPIQPSDILGKPYTHDPIIHQCVKLWMAGSIATWEQAMMIAVLHLANAKNELQDRCHQLIEVQTLKLLP